VIGKGSGPRHPEGTRLLRASVAGERRRSDLRMIGVIAEMLHKKTGLKPTDTEAGPMSNTVPETTVGMELGDRYSYLHVLDVAGECVDERRLRTTPYALRQRFEGMPSARIRRANFNGDHDP